ncbi:MAG: hypothetical protein K9M11_00380 [Candidatus Pacebacteria bacterium]|nr:hypothetical protein [Candidatus Paceibacterota bacterium]
MKFLTAIFGTGIYFYAAPILFQYGHNSYFGIPPSFIEPSIRDNIIFFFDLTRIVGQVAQGLSFWIGVGLVFLTLIVWFLISFQVVRGLLLTICLVFLTGFSLLGFYNFGNKIAEMKTEFQIIPEGCLSNQENVTYLVPAFYQTTALIVPFDTDSKKLKGSFFPRESSELGCEIQKTTIGPVLR